MKPEMKIRLNKFFGDAMEDESTASVVVLAMRKGAVHSIVEGDQPAAIIMLEIEKASLIRRMCGWDQHRVIGGPPNRAR